jgi:tRNA(adenine34) deaminase
MMQKADHERFMHAAIREALAAEMGGNPPFGAVLVRKGRVIASGRNTKTTTGRRIGHAEIQALWELRDGGRAARAETTLYATVEPCAMCLGAALFTGLGRIVYGTPDPLGGAVAMFSAHPVYGAWLPEVVGGVLEAECEALRLRAMEQAEGWTETNGGRET